MTFLTNKTELELDENQKELIRKQGAKIPLTNLTRKVWPKEYASNKKLDGRSKYGIVIRSFMKSNEIEYTTSKVIPRDVRISEEQKDFIQKKLDVLTPHHIATLRKDKRGPHVPGKNRIMTTLSARSKPPPR